MKSASPTHIVIVGATSTIAVHVARRWVEAGARHLRLIGRDAGRLESVADDLRARASTLDVECVALDLSEPQAIAAAVADTIKRGAPQVVLIAHGAMHDQSDMQRDLVLASDQLVSAGVSPALWLEAFADAMPSGTIAVIGSPAGDRGRARNYLYGAAKAVLEHSAEGLQQRFAQHGGPRIVLIKPGPTRTRMTAHLDTARMADPAVVATGIVRAIALGRPVAYIPGIWRWIMVVVRSLPRSVYHRTKF